MDSKNYVKGLESKPVAKIGWIILKLGIGRHFKMPISWLLV